LVKRGGGRGVTTTYLNLIQPLLSVGLLQMRTRKTSCQDSHTREIKLEKMITAKCSKWTNPNY